MPANSSGREALNTIRMKDTVLEKVAPMYDHTDKEEYHSCRNNKADDGSGFKHMLIPAGEKAIREQLPYNTIVMIRKGCTKINCGDFLGAEVHAGQMLLLPRQTPFDREALEDTECVLFRFHTPISHCDMLMLESLWPVCEQNGYDFKPTPIKPALNMLLDMLLLYMANGANCVHFHEMKHREFFFFLRTFYTRTEIAHLLHPLVGKSLTFRDMIIQNSKHASSVGELIEMSNMGKTRFHAQFKQEFGQTAKHWMIKQQEKAIHYEASKPGISVKELMVKFGFETSSGFAQFCKQHFGCTPSQLIEQVKAR